MDLIKEAFSKIKEDIESLRNEFSNIYTSIEVLTDNQTTLQENLSKTVSRLNKQTNQHNISPQNNPLESLPSQDIGFSTGNEGVPTDKQTNQLTDQQKDNYVEQPSKGSKSQEISDFQKANEMLESLDEIKREIRLKFKGLTSQEMIVFSTIYGLEEQNLQEITYRVLAGKLTLSESSVRDYTNKLIKKGIPLIKIRQNNKKILLKISEDLKGIAPLSTILMLREL